MVQKSHIHVTKMSDALSSNCQLAIKGIEPQQQIDLCTDHYTNFTLIGTVDSQSSITLWCGLRINSAYVMPMLCRCYAYVMPMLCLCYADFYLCYAKTQSHSSGYYKYLFRFNGK